MAIIRQVNLAYLLCCGVVYTYVVKGVQSSLLCPNSNNLIGNQLLMEGKAGSQKMFPRFKHSKTAATGPLPIERAQKLM